MRHAVREASPCSACLPACIGIVRLLRRSLNSPACPYALPTGVLLVLDSCALRRAVLNRHAEWLPLHKQQQQLLQLQLRAGWTECEGPTGPPGLRTNAHTNTHLRYEYVR